MIVFMLLAMACIITGQVFHEWLGIFLFILFIVHNVLNRSWYQTLLKGKYNAVRVFHTAVNMLLLIAMLGILVSGIMLSHTVFAFLNIRGGLLVQKLHILSTNWGFIFMSMHLGVHWEKIMGVMKTATRCTALSWSRTVILRIVAVLIAAYGLYAFINREVAFKLTAYYLYDFWNPDQPIATFFIDYLSIMGLFTGGTYYARKVFRQFSSKRNQLEVKKS
jgi:hypothetical protein